MLFRSSGGNAFDVFSPEVLKEEIRKWPAEEAPNMKQDFTRINFGWLGYFVPNETTTGTQPDMLEYVTSVAAAWDCPISIHSNIAAFEAHPRTLDNMEVMRRWEEVRAKKWLTEKQKEELQNLDQEHHLLINEKGEFELVPYEQINNIAGGSKEVRAFIFKRNNAYYVVYWHTSGNRKLKLPVKSSELTLYKSLGENEFITESPENYSIIPINDRRYLKMNRLKKKEILDILAKAEIID